MSYYADETYDVYETSYPVARKEHRCEACGHTIYPKEVYAKVRVVYDGTAETIKRCGRCESIHKHLRDLCAGEDMWPDERLGCGLDYEEEWGEKPPSEVVALPLLSSAEASHLANEMRLEEKRKAQKRREEREKFQSDMYAIRSLGWLLYGIPLTENPHGWRWRHAS